MQLNCPHWRKEKKDIKPYLDWEVFLQKQKNPVKYVKILTVFYFFMIISFNSYDNPSVTQNLIRSPIQFFFRIDG